MVFTWLMWATAALSLDLTYRDLQSLDRSGGAPLDQPQWLEERVFQVDTPVGRDWISGRSVFETLLSLEIGRDDLRVEASTLHELERAVRLRVRDRLNRLSPEEAKNRIRRAAAVMAFSRALDAQVKIKDLGTQVGIDSDVSRARLEYAIHQLMSSGLILRGVLPAGAGLGVERTLAEWYRVFLRLFGNEPIELGVEWHAAIPGTEGLRDAMSRENQSQFFAETVLAFESLPQVTIRDVAQLWIEELAHWDLVSVPNERVLERLIEDTEVAVRVATQNEVDRLFFEGESDRLRLLALELARFSQERFGADFREYRDGLLGWLSRMERRFLELPFVVFSREVNRQLLERQQSRSVPYLRQLALRSWVSQSEGVLQRRLETAVSRAELERRRALPRAAESIVRYRVKGEFFRLSGVENPERAIRDIEERTQYWNRLWRSNSRLHTRELLLRDRLRFGRKVLGDLESRIEISDQFDVGGDWSRARAQEVTVKWLLSQDAMTRDQAGVWASETFLVLNQREPFRVLAGTFAGDPDGTLWVAVLHEIEAQESALIDTATWTDSELRTQIRGKTRDLVLRQSIRGLLQTARLRSLRAFGFIEESSDWTPQRLLRDLIPVSFWEDSVRRDQSLNRASEWHEVQAVNLSWIEAAFGAEASEGLSFRERVLEEWSVRSSRDPLCGEREQELASDLIQCFSR